LGGSGHNDVRIPLANHLFEPLRGFEAQFTRYPQVRPVLERLRDSVRRDDGNGIEAELERLQAEAESDPRRGVQLSAVLFYLRALIAETERRWLDATSGVTNYAELLDRLGNHHAKSGEPVRVVTFNYDTLIDLAFADALQLRVDDGEFLRGYTSSENFKLYKVHGSTNWHQVVRGDVQVSGGDIERARALIERGSALEPELDSFALLQGRDQDVTQRGDLLMMPAIALPLTSKDEFVMPAEHVKDLKRDLAKVTRALVVGWKAADTRLLNVWTEVAVSGISPDLLVVSQNAESAQTIADSLGERGIFGEAQVFNGSGFSDFLSESGPLETFLAGTGLR
jgi:hypothetical protein